MNRAFRPLATSLSPIPAFFAALVADDAAVFLLGARAAFGLSSFMTH